MVVRVGGDLWPGDLTAASAMEFCPGGVSPLGVFAEINGGLLHKAGRCLLDNDVQLHRAGGVRPSTSRTVPGGPCSSAIASSTSRTMGGRTRIQANFNFFYAGVAFQMIPPNLSVRGVTATILSQGLAPAPTSAGAASGQCAILVASSLQTDSFVGAGWRSFLGS